MCFLKSLGVPFVLYSPSTNSHENNENNNNNGISLTASSEHKIQIETPTQTQDQTNLLFQREMTIISSLHHPNLISVLSPTSSIIRHKHQSNQITSVAVEYYSGPSLLVRLHDNVTQQLWPTRKRQLEYVRDIICAVLSLHGHTPSAIFHGDIQSDNIIFAADGRLVLVGFGSAIYADSLDAEKKYLHCAIDMRSLAKLFFDIFAPPCQLKQFVFEKIQQNILSTLHHIVHDVVQREIIETCLSFASPDADGSVYHMLLPSSLLPSSSTTIPLTHISPYLLSASPLQTPLSPASQLPTSCAALAHMIHLCDNELQVTCTSFFSFFFWIRDEMRGRIKRAKKRKKRITFSYIFR